MYSYQSPIIRLLFNYYWLVSFLLFLIIIGCGVIFFLGPYHVETIVQKNAEYEHSKWMLEEKEQYLDQIKDFKQSFSNISDEDMEKVAIALPSSAEVPELMVQLEALASNINKGFVLKSFSSQNTQAGELDALGIKAISISAKFLGPDDYQSWKELLLKIEKNMRLFKVLSTEYVPERGFYDLDLQAYYYEG